VTDTTTKIGTRQNGNFKVETPTRQGQGLGQGQSEGIDVPYRILRVKRDESQLLRNRQKVINNDTFLSSLESCHRSFSDGIIIFEITKSFTQQSTF